MTDPPPRGIFHPPAPLLICWFFIAAQVAFSAPGEAGDSLAQKSALLYAEGAYRDVVNMLMVLPSDSLSAPAAFYLGSSSAALGDIRNATRNLRTAVALAPSHTGYRFQYARVLAQGGIVAEARVQYEILVAGDHPFPPALTSYGTFLFDDADYRAATTAYRRSLAENPRDFLSNYYIGACFERLEEPDSAELYLATSITLNPDYAPAGSLLAALYFARSDYHQSLRLYERLCKQRPRNPDYWYRAGLCSERLGSDYLAVDLFRRAAMLDSSDALYFAHIGQIFFGLNRFDSSVTAYRRAVSLEAGNSVLLLNLGLALARMDSAAQAVTVFQQAADAHQVEKAAVPYTQKGAILYNQKNYRRARGAYTKALMLDPANMEALFFIGFTLEQTGASSEARRAFKKYLKAAAENPMLKTRVGLVEERLHKLPQDR